MEHKNLKENVDEIISSELAYARSKFNNFVSAHEGYAVVLEEFDELKEEVENFEKAIGALWKSVKANDETLQAENIEAMDRISMHIIKEAIQISAMCRRFYEDVSKK